MKSDKDYAAEWNKMHIDFITERNNAMADYCETMILEAKDVYYNSGDPIMSDDQYDRFESYLKSLRPDSKVLLVVGDGEVESVE